MRPSPPVTPTPPLDLARLVMRRAGRVGVAVLALALGLGLARVAYDMDDEVDGAFTLARLIAQLGQLPQTEDAAALAALRALQGQQPTRHLVLRVHDDRGRLLLDAPPAPPLAASWQALLDLHRRWLSASETRAVHWPLARPAGAPWTVTLQASHEAERREALANLGGTLGLLLVCTVGLLAVMRWNVRHALAPLGRLLEAIGEIGSRGDAHALQALPAMPTGELESLATALRRLADALAAAEARRRELARQVQTLQEDERARLARELHDELGQHLTALRVDAAWLARRVAGQPALAEVVAAMAATCQHLQHDVRHLLARLQPFGPGAAAGGAAGQPLARLVQLLQGLVDAWTPAEGPPGQPRQAAVPQLRLQALDDAGRPQPWPDPGAAATLHLAEPLALALYRIAQEGLTNVARHAGAQQATLTLSLQGALWPGAALRVACAVVDDGVGLPAGDGGGPRGNGLGGIRERVWALGGELQLGPALAGEIVAGAGPGLALRAAFDTRWLAGPSAADLPPEPESP